MSFLPEIPGIMDLSTLNSSTKEDILLFLAAELCRFSSCCDLRFLVDAVAIRLLLLSSSLVQVMVLELLRDSFTSTALWRLRGGGAGERKTLRPWVSRTWAGRQRCFDAQTTVERKEGSDGENGRVLLAEDTVFRQKASGETFFFPSRHAKMSRLVSADSA